LFDNHFIILPTISRFTKRSIIFIVMKKAFKFLFLPALIFSASVICQAQDKFKVGVSMGQVYPLNEFKSVGPASNAAGYAQTGFTLNVDGDYFIQNRFSLSLRFHFGNAPVNQAEFKNRLDNELKDYFTEIDTLHYDINYWQWVSPLIGCKFNYPIVSNKVYVEAGIFTGISFIQIPDQNLAMVTTYKSHQKLLISKNIEKNDISIPFAFNAGFRFRINNSVQFKINAEYYQTKANYNHESYFQSLDTAALEKIEKYAFNVPIQTINATIGLVYNF
jgi:hypothetical protein